MRQCKGWYKLSYKNYIFSKLKLSDGLHLSVQALRDHMWSSRETIDNGSEYNEVDVYSHGKYIDKLARYSLETRFTYGYAHVEVMEELIEKHGGIAA